jgi:hypothetical protein
MYIIITCANDDVACIGAKPSVDLPELHQSFSTIVKESPIWDLSAVSAQDLPVKKLPTQSRPGKIHAVCTLEVPEAGEELTFQKFGVEGTHQSEVPCGGPGSPGGEQSAVGSVLSPKRTGI